MKTLLVHPPLGDPTSEYHSIPHLVGAAQDAGFAVDAVDANLQCLEFLAAEARVSELIAECRRLVQECESRDSLTRLEQLRYSYALLAQHLRPSNVASAVDVLRDPKQFYDPATYKRAAETLSLWLDVLSVQGVPGQFDGFTYDINYVINFSSSGDIANPATRDLYVAPFSDFLNEFATRVARSSYDCVGISIPFVSQLLPALAMAQQIKARCPNVYLCAGGTELTDVAKYAADPSVFWKVFRHFDCVVVGEGETAFTKVLTSLRSGQRPRSGQGVWVQNDWRRGLAASAVPHYEDLAALASPDYSVWDHNEYWSPDRLLLYSPTRGCYWNRCTFCDYGLNTDGPTSPSRERGVKRTLDDLAELAKRASFIYFAVDAISPSYLRRVCAGMVERGLSIPWCAELRLEKTFRGELPHLLAASGCVAISFGFESATQSVLDRIDKGVAISQVASVLAGLRDEGIAAQIMGFVGFPGETPQEASQTFRYLLENMSLWTLAGIGDFVLTSGAMVAKHPEEFGVTTSPYVGEDIRRSLAWEDQRGVRVPGDQDVDDIRAQVGSSRPNLMERPFVGGIDSTHTLLYAHKFGMSFPDLFTQVEPVPTKITSKVSNLEGLTSKSDVYVKCAAIRGAKIGPSASQMLAWMSELSPVCRSTTARAYTYLGRSGYLRTYTREELDEYSEAFRTIQTLLFDHIAS